MGWDDVRGGTALAARTAAHSDDAKHRVDESTRTPTARPRLPLLVGAGAVALLLLGGTAVALTRSGGDGNDPSTKQPAAATSTSPSPSGAASDAPAAAVTSGAISYDGTLTSDGRTSPQPLGVACQDETTCNLTGLAFGGADVVPLGRTGPGTFTISLPAVPGTCDRAPSGATSGTVVLSGRTITMRARVGGAKVSCPDGSLETGTSVLRYRGTYVDGEIPGFEVG